MQAAGSVEVGKDVELDVKNEHDELDVVDDDADELDGVDDGDDAWDSRTKQ